MVNLIVIMLHGRPKCRLVTEMDNIISFGKKENYGEIDFSKLRSGITKENLGIKEGTFLATIFDSINTNKEDGKEAKLDKNEFKRK